MPGLDVPVGFAPGRQVCRRRALVSTHNARTRGYPFAPSLEALPLILS